MGGGFDSHALPPGSQVPASSCTTLFLHYTGDMTRIEIQQLALALPERERMALAEALWATFGDRAALPLPKWQEELLDQRMIESAGEAGKDWDQLRTEIWGAGNR